MNFIKKKKKLNYTIIIISAYINKINYNCLMIYNNYSIFIF